MRSIKSRKRQYDHGITTIRKILCSLQYIELPTQFKKTVWKQNFKKSSPARVWVFFGRFSKDRIRQRTPLGEC